MNKSLKKVIFYGCLLVMGSFVIECDTITGHPHHHLCDSVNWFENPMEKENDANQ